MKFSDLRKKGPVLILFAFVYSSISGCGETTLHPTPRNLIISSDNSSCNEGLHEVDDGYALLYALNTPGVNILAITASHGNTTMDKSYECAEKLLRMAGRVVGLFAFFYPSEVTGREFHRLKVVRDPYDPHYTDFKIVDNDPSRPTAEVWLDANKEMFWKTFRKALKINNN